MENNSKEFHKSTVENSQHDTKIIQNNPQQDQNDQWNFQKSSVQYPTYAGQSPQYAEQNQPYAGQNTQYAEQCQQYQGQSQQNLGQNKQNEGQAQQKQKKNKIFQKKIILGSVCGFIATAIGTIAVFFPSLFNLEIKKVDELKILIQTENDAKTLYDFLKSHENKIIQLDLSYKNEYSLYDNVTRRNEYNYDDFYDNTVCRLVKDGDSTWMSCAKLEKDDFKNPKINFLIEKSIQEIKPKKEYFYTAFGENKLFSVISECDFSVEQGLLDRENGGFGFWLPSMKIGEKGDESDGPQLEFAFQVAIRDKADNKRRYKWGKKDQKAQDDGFIIERLTGMFYVNTLMDYIDVEIDPEIISFMSPKYAEKFQSRYGEAIAAPNIFFLDPITKKEMDIKNY